jgi:acylphosphatase
MPKRSLRCTISGRVQGVFYRANTQKEAQKLGITGWVRNLPDGRVEALLSGEEETLAMMKTWLTKGHPLAKVLKVEIEEVVFEECFDFKVIE